MDINAPWLKPVKDVILLNQRLGTTHIGYDTPRGSSSYVWLGTPPMHVFEISQGLMALIKAFEVEVDKASGVPWQKL